MKHLTVDEMIDFVSFNKLDSESLALASKVNAHIFECHTCRKKVEAFQIIYDELVKMGRKEEFRSVVNNKLSDLKEKKNQAKKQIDDYM